MATSLYGHRCSSSTTWQVKNALDGRSVLDKGSHVYTKTLTEGVGANQAQIVFHDSGTVATSDQNDVDLSGTAIQTGFGANIALTEIKEFKFENTGTVPLTIGGGTDGLGAAAVLLFGDAAHMVVVPAGGLLHLVAPTAGGIAVTATTADILSIVNPSATVVGAYKLTIIGN